ncbi:MAG: archaetidylserine decarboxylase [Porticoccaceae bacterium]|nr:phosphatidylserine decarboxylase [Pseudomonadales bacterium]MCP5170998.1 phosphatidylserine decarboxylase [Pseudomonadales bacterium]MCP5301764.1 phosphatidylserine decarboxylase [Pseudomonadales bacterium]
MSNKPSATGQASADQYSTDHVGECFAALQRILPQHLLSRLGARLAESRIHWLKNWLIKGFSSVYKINLAEAESANPDDYENFNAFFTRALKPDLRPVDSGPETVVSPADGAVSQIGNISTGAVFQAKGKSFTVEALLGANDQDSHAFQEGLFTTIYLSPQDYHRVHMPIEGRLLYCRYIPGKLYSVNNATASHIDGLFAKNERLVCVFDTPAGRCAVILVGAMMVAGIETVWHGQYTAQMPLTTTYTDRHSVSLKKGEELGRFKFGSTVILLFEKDAVEWQPHFQHGSTTRMGEKLARQVTGATE